MKHKYKGLKENPVISIEKKIYKDKNTKGKRKSYKMHGFLEGIHLPCIRNTRWTGHRLDPQPAAVNLDLEPAGNVHIAVIS
jgi:hypothetical protein